MPGGVYMVYPDSEEFPPIIKGASWGGFSYTYCEEDGTPIDLTDYGAEFIVADSKTATTSIMTLTTAANQITLGDTTGTINFEQISPTITSALPTVSRRVAALKLIHPDGVNVDFLLTGYIDIQEVI